MMNNNINTQSGERLSFYKLFCEKQYRISIPIIQRDYAQGRQTTTEVRSIFLDALFNYLDENEPNRDLDFVYGSLNETGGMTDFIPLDGQQRLTTLFLLHWYLYQISDNTEKKEEFKKALLKDGKKSMFIYETRRSSSEFCDVLMKNDIDFKQLIDNSLSKTIENSSWFFLSWKYDPTIQSMLTMLDAIHNRFADKNEYFERLIDKEKPIITFLFLNLKDFRLTDDLYIKMNSRGKPLTPFENFKAKFEQHLENVNPQNREFDLSHKNNVSLKEYFSYNIDTKWANLFWNYRELIGDKDVYDEELKNFIRVMFANQYALSNEKDDNLEFLLGTQVAKKRKDYTDNISYYKYQELSAITEQSILYLIDAFDNLVNRNGKIQTYLSEDYKFYFDENEIFEKALKYSFSNNQERVLFHAYIRFLIKNMNDRTGIEQWMRVIHNLANNTIIDGADEISRAIKSIEKLLPASNDILKHLSEENSQIESFSSWQVLEEKIKAQLILRDDNWKEKIEKLEKHQYFDGQISFLLKFSGILCYYDKNNNCNWPLQKNEDFFKSFKNYAEKSIRIFNEKGLNKLDNFLFERALLATGDYLLRKGRNMSFLIDNDRNISWKRLLRDNNEKRKILKELLDKIISIETLNEDLQNCINKFDDKEDWRYYFIKQPEIIAVSGTDKLIRWNNENNILVLGSSTTSGYHRDYYCFSLYLEIKKIFANIDKDIDSTQLRQKSVDYQKSFTVKIDDILYTISYTNGKYHIKDSNNSEQIFDDQSSILCFLKEQKNEIGTYIV